MALLDMPESIYNWIVNFFQGHSHCTRLGDVVSSMATINSSVVQGSAIGPAAYIVTASDLHPLDPSNTTDKFADDSCLIIPADRESSNVDELDQIEQWAAVNNLTLNRGKSAEIVFRNSRSRERVVLPSPPPGIIRVESVKILGVTINQNLGFSDHVCPVVASGAQTLYTLRTLRAHGIPDAAIHTIFQSTDLARLQ